jgi:hypothetical protein
VTIWSPLGCIDIDVLLGPFGDLATPDYGNKNSTGECLFRGDIPSIATVSDKVFRVIPLASDKYRRLPADSSDAPRFDQLNLLVHPAVLGHRQKKVI